MIWFTSDTHFNDATIIQYIPHMILNKVGCPASFSNKKIREWLDSYICEQWTRLIQPEDTIYHLGDVGRFKDETEAWHLLHKLPGHKILILGNHDTDPDYGIKQDAINFWKAASFDEVHKYYTLNEFLHLQHIPPYFTNAPYMWLYGHVHSIDMYRTITPISCCVCTERFLFRPVSYDFIAETRKKILANLNEDGQSDVIMTDDMDIAEELNEYIETR